MWKPGCGEGEETARIIYCSGDRVPGNQEEILNGNIALFWQNSAQCVYLPLRWKQVLGTQTFSILRKMTQTERKSNTSERERVHLCTHQLDTVRMQSEETKSERLTKELSGSVFLLSSPWEQRFLENPRIYPWQLQAICNVITIMQDSHVSLGGESAGATQVPERRESCAQGRQPRRVCAWLCWSLRWVRTVKEMGLITSEREGNCQEETPCQTNCFHSRCRCRSFNNTHFRHVLHLSSPLCFSSEKPPLAGFLLWDFLFFYFEKRYLWNVGISSTRVGVLNQFRNVFIIFFSPWLWNSSPGLPVLNVIPLLARRLNIFAEQNDVGFVNAHSLSGMRTKQVPPPSTVWDRMCFMKRNWASCPVRLRFTDSH